MRTSLLTAAAVLAFALPAAAQERTFNFSLGAGVEAAPEYMGSNAHSGSVSPLFTFGALRWGQLDVGNGVRNAPDNGISLGPAFRILGERNADDSAELTGLNDIDIGVELGLRLAYQETNWLTFGEVRKGVAGHSGITGTLGADWILRPNERWLITAGPRVNFGDNEFTDTYFGITPEGAAASRFDSAFDATGGALSAGLAVSGTYFIDEKWALEGTASYERLLGDAANSPITLNGSEDQWRIGLGLSRTFTLDF